MMVGTPPPTNALAGKSAIQKEQQRERVIYVTQQFFTYVSRGA